MFGFFKRWFVSAEERKAQAQRRGKPRLNARGGMRVLIVDDSQTIVAILRRMLQQNGYLVLEAFDAEKGIELAMAERPDLVFLDIVLPGMSGFQALRFLRREASTRNIPIIMMSGNEQATEQFYAQRIGADDFMKKPFSRAEVFARIERLLDDSLLPRRTIQVRAAASASAVATAASTQP
ncbi:MAG: response regulator [Dokdonella sp.]